MRITTKSSPGWVRIIFKDNGPGISEENLTKIFNPFFTTKEVGKGTGLGLSLTLGIIQEHGGSIRVESKFGGGGKVIIEIPGMEKRSEERRVGKEGRTRGAPYH